MKKLIIAMIALLAALSGQAATKSQAAAKSARIVAFSDCHVLAPSLKAPQGTYTCLTSQSASILQAMVARCLELKPQVVVITGDLTHNGEIESHRFVASQLARLTAAGIRVLVVPGNHDISNPGAATTITRSQWRELYKGMGYDPATSQLDTASLSYATQAAPGLVVLGIDTNRDEENLCKSRGDSLNSYHNAGRIHSSTLQWVADRAREARQAGNQVIALCHHHVGEHFDSEAQLMKNYVISNHQEAVDTLTAAGVHLLLTGHLHVTDACRAWNEEATDSLTELATGSLCTYPMHYRVLDVSGGRVKVTTASIGTQQQLAQARGLIEQYAPVMLKAKLGALYDKIGGKLKQLTSALSFGGDEGEQGDLGMPSREALDSAIDQEIAPMAVKAMLLMLDGNEGQHGGTEAMKQVRQLFEQATTMMLPGMMGGMGSMLIEQLYPQVEAVASSLLEDKNAVGTDHEAVVDDLQLTVKL